MAICGCHIKKREGYCGSENEGSYHLFELLPEQAKQSAYDYLLFLSNRCQPTVADITRAMRSAKASLQVEGLDVSDQEVALVLSRIS